MIKRPDLMMDIEIIKQGIREAAERMGLDYDDLAPMIPEVVEDSIPKAEQLIQMIQNGDIEQVHAIAHDLKGVSANYGLAPLSEMAKFIELNRTEAPIDKAKELFAAFQNLVGLEL